MKNFNSALEEENCAWEDEEEARQEAAQEHAVANALREDPDMDPENVPVMELPQRFFLCQRTLERCLNKMATEIFPTDAVFFQEDYMRETSKPRSMTAKQWVNRLEEMKGYLYWLSENNYKMSNLVFNKDCIKSNIPLEWRVNFEESDISRKINRSTDR